MSEPKQDGEWLRAGNCVYELETYEFQGKQRQRNRWWIAVYGAHTTPQEEVDRIAQKVQASHDFYDAAKALCDRHDERARAANFAGCGCEDCTPFRAALKKAVGE